MEIFDPIHGSISICNRAKRIIDTHEFQRLRNIKQLGCCYYIFQGASHNRFEHSIGVYHLAQKYISILNNGKLFTEHTTMLIAISALIHDIGHGPYSHLFDEFTNSEHEERSIEIFKYMNKKYELEYTIEDIEFISNTINPSKKYTKYPEYNFQIVSNPNGIDVDRMDYIMRDTFMIGLNYGIECNRIMNGSKIIDNSIQYSQKVFTPIEDFYRIRNILYKEVYNHHAVRSIEYMIKGILYTIDPLFRINETIVSKTWDTFITYTDSICDSILLYKDLISNNNIITKAINDIQRIKKRDIIKLYGEIMTEDPLNITTTSCIIDTICISYYNKIKPIFYNEEKKRFKRELTDYKPIIINRLYYDSYDGLIEASTIYNKLTL